MNPRKRQNDEKDQEKVDKTETKSQKNNSTLCLLVRFKNEGQLKETYPGQFRIFSDTGFASLRVEAERLEEVRADENICSCTETGKVKFRLV